MLHFNLKNKSYMYNSSTTPLRVFFMVVTYSVYSLTFSFLKGSWIVTRGCRRQRAGTRTFFDSYDLPASCFSLQYHHIVEQTGYENNKIHQLHIGDIVLWNGTT